MSKCIICGKETGSRQDTCSAQCWLIARKNEAAKLGFYAEVNQVVM